MGVLRCIIAVAIGLTLGVWFVHAKPFLIHPAPDTTAPTIVSATVASNGTTLTAVPDEPLFLTDATGFTAVVGGEERSLTYSSGSGTESIVFTASEIYQDEIVDFSYASATGSATDAFSNPLENGSVTATNNSTQIPTPDDTTPPEYVSSTIAPNGLDVTFLFNEAVVIANANGFTFTPSGGAGTLTYASGSGTSTVNFTSSRAIESDETATTQYSSTTGDVEDLYGNDLATFGSSAVTNDSTYDSSDPFTPNPPETFNTAYSLPAGGTTFTPANTAELTTALATAVGGDKIVLQAGTTYTSNFKLRNWGAGTDWIYIISSDMADLPPEGERVSLADAADMPRLTSNTAAPLHSDFGAHHYRLAGIEIVTGARDALTTVQLGYAGNFVTAASTLSDLPNHITFDRCLIHSTSDAHRLRHGIMINGQYMACVDSYIANVKDSNDAQALWAYSGQGPFKYVNNFLEATGEVVMFGGTDTPISGCVPSDIEVRGNHLFKRLGWKNPSPNWSIKNTFELKNAQRVLVTGNVLENNWADAQSGIMVLFTVRNQSGSNPWAVVQDVRFQNNFLKNSSRFFNITGKDNLQSSQQTQRLFIDNNLGIEASYDNGTQPGFMQFAGLDGAPVLYATVTNNTFLSPDGELGPYSHVAMATTAITHVDHMIYQNNILCHGSYATAWARTTNSTHSHNVLSMNPLDFNYAFSKGAFATQNPGEFMADPGQTAIVFEDLAGGDYRLDAASPFKGDGVGGVDPGCDIDELEAATAGAVSGVW